MLANLFESSTIPVLEQVVQFTQLRHGVLAGNVANLDTPGYKTRDLSSELFEEKLLDAIETRRKGQSSSPYANRYSDTGWPIASSDAPSKRDVDDFSDVKEAMKSILYHDESDVAIEKQVTEIAKNQAQHNLAMSIMISQFQLLEAAISERA